MAAAVAANAQSHTHAVSYEHSAFRNMRYTPAAANPSVANRQTLMQHFPSWTATSDKLTGSVRDMYGPAIALSGSDLSAKAVYCMDHMLAGAGIVSSQWQQLRNVRAGHASFVDYEQYINGRKVVFSRLSFRFTNDDRLMRVKMNLYGEPVNGLAPSLDAQAALAAASQDMAGATITAQQVTGDWVWFPVPSAQGYTLHPAWAFSISGKGADGFPMALSGYVDATDGTLLYRTNQVKEAVNVTVKADVNKINPTLGPATTEPLPNLLVTLSGTNYYTDTAGFLNVNRLVQRRYTGIPGHDQCKRHYVYFSAGIAQQQPARKCLLSCEPRT
jgi:hypothetical protein